jgi:hypothetical protein
MREERELMYDPNAVEQATQVKERHEREIMQKKYVVGIGVGFKEQGKVRSQQLSLVVYVSQKLPETALDPQDRIPPSIEGIPTDVVEVGKIKAL